ncbi:TRAP transporter small permease [Roseomonas genomospecies 6]|uniref:TRAP transporter small permease protein n=1 Tax=Roseomonas genomospecies 6 TaxID=214106 RepID=A0A9W7NIP2_9PROT|nr:TRAP transporter small permease [Roseomonas genomospecies 6]KAA0679781.1 TRAP transporter small permease [Roseomonas genomospecies 6]
MSSLFHKGEAFLAMLLLAAIVLLVFAAGVMRWFGHPLVWSVDVAQLLFVWVAFLGADMALRKRAHIGIDYLVKRLPVKSRAMLDLVLGVLVVAFLMTMVVMGYRLTMLNLERQFGDSGISYAFVTSAVPVGCLLLAATLTGQILDTLRELRRHPKPVFAPAPKPGEIEEVVP